MFDSNNVAVGKMQTVNIKPFNCHILLCIFVWEEISFSEEKNAKFVFLEYTRNNTSNSAFALCLFVWLCAVADN